MPCDIVTLDMNLDVSTTLRPFTAGFHQVKVSIGGVSLTVAPWLLVVGVVGVNVLSEWLI